MDDLEIVARIGELTDEEHALERAHGGTALSDADEEIEETRVKARALLAVLGGASAPSE